MTRLIRSNLVHLKTPLPSELMRALKPPAHKLHLAICITIGKSSYEQLATTLKSTLRNIRLLCSLFQGFKPDNVAIFLIHDGLDGLDSKFTDEAHRRILLKDKLHAIPRRLRKLRSESNSEQ